MASLDDLRDETRRIDEQLLELIIRRTAMGEAIAELKRQKGVELYDEAHIQEILRIVREEAKKHNLNPRSLERIFSTLIEMRLERELRKLGQSLASGNKKK